MPAIEAPKKISVTLRIGAAAPRLHIAEEITANRFKIAGGRPGMKVSWQVTGIRHDAYAEAHRISVEEEKPPQERGTYMHPELFGQPEEKGSASVVNPDSMQKIKEEEKQAQLQRRYLKSCGSNCEATSSGRLIPDGDAGVID